MQKKILCLNYSGKMYSMEKKNSVFKLLEYDVFYEEKRIFVSKLLECDVFYAEKILCLSCASRMYSIEKKEFSYFRKLLE